MEYGAIDLHKRESQVRIITAHRPYLIFHEEEERRTKSGLQ
jgi:hypothetical protein